MTSPFPLVRMAGVDLVESFLKIAPTDCLKENLNSLIIGLYPIIESSNHTNIWKCFMGSTAEYQAIHGSNSDLSETFLFDVPEPSSPLISMVISAFYSFVMVNL